MKYLEIIHGSPIATIKGVADQYQCTERTVRNILKEMEGQRSRYGDNFSIGDGNLRRINFLAFTDYYTNRTALKDKNASKYVPPYDAAKVAESLGFYGKQN